MESYHPVSEPVTCTFLAWWMLSTKLDMLNFEVSKMHQARDVKSGWTTYIKNYDVWLLVHLHTVWHSHMNMSLSW